MTKEDGRSPAGAGSGHQPSASAAVPASSQSGVPNADWLREALRSVAKESGGVWADGHRVATCGSHTGHAVRVIAYCENDDWAALLAHAFNEGDQS